MTEFFDPAKIDPYVPFNTREKAGAKARENQQKKRSEQTKKTLSTELDWMSKASKIKIAMPLSKLIRAFKTLETNGPEIIEDTFKEVLANLVEIINIFSKQPGFNPRLQHVIETQSAEYLTQCLGLFRTNIDQGKTSNINCFFLNIEKGSLNFSQGEMFAIYRILKRLILVYKKILTFQVKIEEGKNTKDKSAYGAFVKWVFNRESSPESLSQLLQSMQSDDSKIYRYLKPNITNVSSSEEEEWGTLIAQHPVLYKALLEYKYKIPQAKPTVTLDIETVKYSQVEAVVLTQRYIFIILRVYNNILSSINNYLEYNPETGVYSPKKELDPNLKDRVRRFPKYFNFAISPVTDRTRNSPITIPNQLENQKKLLNDALYLSEGGDKAVRADLHLTIKKAITQAIVTMMKQEAKDSLIKEQDRLKNQSKSEPV